MSRFTVDTRQWRQYLAAEMNHHCEKVKMELIIEFKQRLAEELTRIATRYAIRIEQMHDDDYKAVLHTKVTVEVPDVEEKVT
jgi:excinuclease UvrABC helicase subunit UvrB